MSGRTKTVAAAAVLSCGVAALVFVLVASQGRIPSMPRATFSAEDEDEALKSLEERVRGFEPTEEERELIRLLEEVHRVEASEQEIGSRSEIRKKMEAFKAVASRYSGAKEERYLNLGDYLAAEFAKAFDELLKEIRTLSQSKQKTGSVSLERIKKLGGSFFARCMARGAVTADGRFLASRAAPQTLFRARWRMFGDLRLEQGLSPLEKRAYYDFVAAFASPDAVSQRLAAVRELGILDEGYDTAVARALIFHENGNDEYAYKQLKDAMQAGRGNSAIRNFAKALEP